MRKRWIYRDGKAYEVGVDEIPERPRSHFIMEDIKPYQSTITGEVISSRSKHRAHLRQHNCIEVGNEKLEPKRMPDVGGRKEALIESAKKLGYL